MAKGKHATALFEVIHRNPGTPGLTTRRQDRSFWRNLLRRGQSPPPAVGLGASAPDVPPRAVTPAVPSSSSGAHHPQPARTSWQVDHENQQVTFRVSYPTLIIVSFALLVTISLAFLIVRNTSRNEPLPGGVPDSRLVREGPVYPEVMDVRNRSTPSTEPHRPPTAAEAAPTPTPAVAAAGDRVIGRNYVIIQSYQNEQAAIAARDILARHGITTTIERGLPRYADKSWYILVGTQGFDRLRDNPEYERYIQSIREVSAKHASDSRFKQFAPQPYSWRPER